MYLMMDDFRVFTETCIIGSQLKIHYVLQGLGNIL